MRGLPRILLPTALALLPLLSAGCVDANLDVDPNVEWDSGQQSSHEYHFWWGNYDHYGEAMFALFFMSLIGLLVIALVIVIIVAIVSAINGRGKQPPVQVVYVREPQEFQPRQR